VSDEQKSQVEVAESDRVVLIAIMNALDVHMPPDGMDLLLQIREIAKAAGYPWGREGYSKLAKRARYLARRKERTVEDTERLESIQKGLRRAGDGV
jgi:hypothetical protein